ncbi:MAG: hypothetical protein NPIRA06_18740 [Nitrospirales bacterium]|nr:MAG: hypothetical protein NPIRA06_18740 [Nitrospirales bacterium]
MGDESEKANEQGQGLTFALAHRGWFKKRRNFDRLDTFTADSSQGRHFPR